MSPLAFQAIALNIKGELLRQSSRQGLFLCCLMSVESMRIILNQDVDKVGKQGETVNVKNGFARNFLIPAGLALPLTTGNLKKLEQEKLNKTLQIEKIKQDAQQLKDRLINLSLTLPVLTQDNDEKLYGSVTSSDISGLLKEEGFDIDKNSIILEEPIRSLGIYEIPVKLHPEVSATIKVWVVKK